MHRHLAQLNIATLRHPIDDPRIADFVDGLPMVNGAGESSPGYLWRLQSDSGDATDIRVFDDPLVIVNLTLWESLDALKAFAYRGVHRDFFRRRAEWFAPGASRTALWWVPAGVVPTTDDAKRRLDFIDAVGVSPYAFEMGQHHPPLVVDHVRSDDERLRELMRQTNRDVAQTSADDGVVVVELDETPVAFGISHRTDVSTAEISRIHVSQPARGLRVGVAIVAELEAAATGAGALRLRLHTMPQQLDAYEKFGFRQRPCDHDNSGSTKSICMEKPLVAEPSRLA